MSEIYLPKPWHSRAVVAALWIVNAVWARRTWLAALLVSALVPVSVRLLLMGEGGQQIRGFDLPGAVSDFGLGVLVATVLLALRRIGLVALFVGCAAWLALNLGYYEFMREYASPYYLIHVAYAFDPKFVEGSGLSFTHPYLAVLTSAAFIALIIFAGRGLRPGPWSLCLVLAGYVLLIQLLPSWSTVSPWRQRDFLSVNIADIATRILWPDRLEEDLEAGGSLLPAYLKPDLSGAPLLPARPRTNIVLVFIEGISGGQIPSLAAAHGLDPELRMPMLDALARDNLSYSTFITHQKQTNRGLYAALCGELPRLVAGLAEMTVIAEGAGKDCLPAELEKAGYENVFLSSAGKSFQSKGDFMRKIGFQQVSDSDDFDPSLWRSGWGVDDASLYQVALDRIGTLRAAGQPYFVSIETTSTHHPFTTPEILPPGADARRAAWAFADRSAADFVAALRERGQLDDTLVLITSDEGTGVREANRSKEGYLQGFTENWGFMVAVAPGGHHGRIDRAFQQADIPLSVLDYLGLGQGKGQFIGRSFFRNYDTPRTIYSANIYKSRIHEYVEGGSLTICNEMLANCVQFDTTAAPLFAFDHPRKQDAVGPTQLMHAVRAYSVLGRENRGNAGAGG